MLTTYRRDFGQPPNNQQNSGEGVLKDGDKTSGSNCCNLVAPSFALNTSDTIQPSTTPAAVTKVPEKKSDCQAEAQHTTAKQQKITTKCPIPKPCNPPSGPPTRESILAQHMCCPQLRSTYQLDFCKLCEGDYKDDEGWMRLPSMLKPPSRRKTEFNAAKDQEEPLDLGKEDAQQGLQKVRLVSEYGGTISRVGCVIASNRIHDHSKCNMPTNCHHTISRFC